MVRTRFILQLPLLDQEILRELMVSFSMSISARRVGKARTLACQSYNPRGPKSNFV